MTHTVGRRTPTFTIVCPTLACESAPSAAVPSTAALVEPDAATRTVSIALGYGDLAVTHARAREIAETSCAIEIIVRDADAIHSLTIDPPIVTSPELMPIAGAFGDRFGVGAAVCGDVAPVGDPDRAAPGTRAQGAVHVLLQDGAGGWSGAYVIRLPRHLGPLTVPVGAGANLASVAMHAASSGSAQRDVGDAFHLYDFTESGPSGPPRPWGPPP